MNKVRYPKYQFWLDTYKKVQLELKQQSFANPPPKFLILAGWEASNAHQKNERWEMICSWATDNGLSHIIPTLNDCDYE